MSKKEIINILKNNSNLEIRENLFHFEEALEKLIEVQLDKSDIVELMMILNDENPHQ